MVADGLPDNVIKSGFYVPSEHFVGRNKVQISQSVPVGTHGAIVGKPHQTFRWNVKVYLLSGLLPINCSSGTKSFFLT